MVLVSLHSSRALAATEAEPLDAAHIKAEERANVFWVIENSRPERRMLPMKMQDSFSCFMKDDYFLQYFSYYTELCQLEG